MNRELGSVLAEVRVAAKLTQTQLAERLRTSQAQISRLEAGDGELKDFLAYLREVGSAWAEEVAGVLKAEWRCLPRPSLRHADIPALIEIESGLQRVQLFLGEHPIPAKLVLQAQLLSRRLEEIGRELQALNYKIVYVGEIGVGKTTAACRQAGLVLDDNTAADLKGLLLDTGGGRTTLCEVQVESSDRFAISVEAVPDEEIYKLVAEMCRGIRQKITGEVSAAQVDFRPPEEVERALRNMAGIPRPPRPRRGGEALPDPAILLAGQFEKLEDLTSEFASRMRLWRRTRSVLEFDGLDMQAGCQWLKTTFAGINGGRIEDVPLPARIVVTVPFPLLTDEARLAISIVDTRGVDGTAVRRDILSHLKDERAITLLCSKWGSAPEPTLQDLLCHAGETDADRTWVSRVAVVALPRAGDARSMRYDSGDVVEDDAAGYDVKMAQVEDALQKKGLVGIDAFAFDASEDVPAKLADFVLQKIKTVRGHQASAARAVIGAVDELIAGRAQAQTRAAMETISEELSAFAGNNLELQDASAPPPYERLLAATISIHPRTVWATTRRAGRFWNFDVYQYLGDGAAGDAKFRSSKVFEELDDLLKSLIARPELNSAKEFLNQISANAAQWTVDFVNASHHHATAVYREPLSRAQELWDECEAIYGTSSGNYRHRVAALLRKWFEQKSEFRAELERRTARAWRACVIQPLMSAAGTEAQS